MAQVGKQVAAIQDRRWAGPEPVFEAGKAITQIEFINAINWYNYIKDMDASRTYLTEYLTKIGDPRAKQVKRVPDKYYRQTLGWTAKLRLDGTTLPEGSDETFDRILGEMFARIVKADKSDDKVEVSEVKPTIQQRTFDKASDIIADVETELDSWKSSEFSLYKYLSDNKISPKLVTHVIAYYKPLLLEIQTAMRKQEPQLVEAYSRYKRADLTAYSKFVMTLVNDAERYANVTRAANPRKPRKKKTVTLDKKLQHIQFLDKFDALQIKSVNPASIIGCSELWLYDTTYKKLTLLRAEGHSGLDINRTTVIGFDPNTSKSKRVGRRTQQVIDGVLRGTKIQARKVLDQATSEFIEANGRMNKATIILRVIK
jgi:hypothetical protein